jgi:alkanesulfonate monooxygenase SsuD/methylene tetrahydromethanopterin reductase-like flavin-dependent oxidoreductase (luciferase family)
MHFGGAMFFTEYSMSAPELARTLEERGFESVWAPEHSHIPLSRKTPFPGGGDVPKQYYDAMDPFVVLAAAGEATKTIKVGTGVCAVARRRFPVGASPTRRIRSRRKQSEQSWR